MDANGLRAAFTRYFAERGHTTVPSASLIPHDPSVLFTIAGMVPFKPYFLGEEAAPWPRATSIQKCFRTPDIEIIGTDTYHCTFFEMLGNFSFGDYFKAEAIPMAWELLTEVFGLDGDRLWITVHDGDDEAEQLWIDKVGVRPERIQRMGDEDNFWTMGDTGPCGPDSEIFFDMGEAFGHDGGPKHGGDERFVEIWNLVFMELNRDADGVLTELPRKNIDTGAGLERILPFLQGHESIFDTDLFVPIIDAAASVLGTAYGTDPSTDVALRVLADHGRAFSMLVADGVLPANEGRGYVLRRVVRRAVLAARRAGVEKPVCPTLVQAATEVLGEAYPALRAQHDLIVNVVAREEAGFDRTLRAGLSRLEEALATGATVLPGDVAFTLHDTHGFPVELTEELARDAGVEVDRAGFDAAMDAQRERARAAATSSRAGDEAAYRALLDAEGPTSFVGRGAENYEVPARVVAVLESADAGGDAGRDRRPGRGDLLGPHPLLRRERWPGRGHRHHRHRVGHRRGRRHRAGRTRTGGAPGPGHRRGAGGAGRAGHDRRGTPGGHPAQPHGDASAACLAARRSRRPRAPAGFPRVARLPALRLLAPRRSPPGRSWTRSSRWRTTPCSPTSPSRRPRPRGTRPRRWGRSRTSATSTARRYAWCRRGLHRSSSAGAPTSTPWARSAPSRCCRRARPAPNTRRIFALTGHASLQRALERERLVQSAAELLRTEPDELLAAIGRMAERQREAEKELARLRQQSSEAEAKSLAEAAVADERGGGGPSRQGGARCPAEPGPGRPAPRRGAGGRARGFAGRHQGGHRGRHRRHSGRHSAGAHAGRHGGGWGRGLGRGGAGGREGSLPDRGGVGRGAAASVRVSGDGAARGPGRVAALDLGARRIGVAFSDSRRSLASPWGTIQRSGDAARDHGAVLEAVREVEASTVVVGLPLSLSGEVGPAARSALDEAEALRALLEPLGVTVETADERFTTVEAERSLRAAGRTGKAARKVVDSAAAMVLLQAWLDNA